MKVNMYMLLLHPFSYDGLSLRYSLTVGSAHSPSALMKKLLSLLRLKCTDIFIDLSVRP